MTIDVVVVPHTHWDREWVMTLGEYQVRLVRVMDRALELLARDPSYCFTLDGQAVPLLDYLEVRPEQRGALVDVLAEGRLNAGPWYVQADQFLPNAESLIRNLQLGTATLRELGATHLMVGYIPDSFGCTSTVPMLLAGFGIKCAFFARGRPPYDQRLPHTEFRWRSPDGSTVLAACHSYGGGTYFSYPDFFSDIEAPSYIPTLSSVLRTFTERMPLNDARASVPVQYLPVGIDHMEPRAELLDLVPAMNRELSSHRLRFGTPWDYFAAVDATGPNLMMHSGEMRGGRQSSMDLVGTLSSRMDLKQANDRCELLLQEYLEPVSTLAAVRARHRYPRGALRKLWRLLIENHPHDSITGCSVDQVNREITQRFETIETTGRYLLKDATRAIVKQLDSRGPSGSLATITFFNPVGSANHGPVQAIVRVPRAVPDIPLAMVDAQGSPTSVRLRHRGNRRKDLESVYMTVEQLVSVTSKTPPADHPVDEVFSLIEVDGVLGDVPAFGYRTFWLVPASTVAVPTARVTGSVVHVENALLYVALREDGTFDLRDKRTDRTYPGINYLLDREDIGDTYDHASFAVPDERDSRSLSVTWRVVDEMPDRVSVAADLAWPLPMGAEPLRRTAGMAAAPITITLTLHADVPRVDVAIEIENRVNDHCLRAAIPTGVNATSSHAYDHLAVVERPVATAGSVWRDDPFQLFVDVSDGVGGIAITSRGLPAYQVINFVEGATLHLTLLRAVGEIGAAAGANHPAPEAQLRRRMRFDYSLLPHGGGWRDGDCMALARAYRAPLIAEGDVPHEGELASASALLTIASDAPEAVFVSCLKDGADGESAVLRLWNSAEREIQLRISSPDCAVTGLTDLNEFGTTHEIADGRTMVDAQALRTLRLCRLA